MSNEECQGCDTKSICLVSIFYKEEIALCVCLKCIVKVMCQIPCEKFREQYKLATTETRKLYNGNK